MVLEQDTADSRDAADVIVQRAADLVQRGENAAAIGACRSLFSRPDLDIATLDTLLWVALTAKSDELAGRIAAAIADLRPVDIERQRTAASLLTHARRFEDALPYAAAAAEIAPDDFESTFLLGVLRNEAGHPSEAIRSLLRAQTLRPDFAETYHQLAVASLALKQPGAAVKMAVKACRLEPRNASRAMFAANQLRELGRLDDAIAVLSGPDAEGEVGAHLKRLLSECLLHAGQLPEAVTQIDAALQLASNHPEFLLFRAGLLTQIGDFEQAVSGVDAALAVDPENLNARRHAVTLYLEGGRYERAVQSTAELLRRVPTNEEYASCMMHVLATRSEAAVELPNIAELKRRAGQRPPRRAPTLADRMKTQARVTGALMLREMRTRFGESRLGYIWVLVEMGIHLGVLAVVFQFMMHGQPPMGHSFFFFYFTGLLPYLLFLHTSEHAGSGIQQNRHMLQLPMVNNFNVILSRGLLEMFTQLVIASLFIAGFLIAGVHAVPSSFGQASAALFFAWLLGLGCGFINAVLNALMHAWHHIFAVVIRILYFCSGIFYVPSAMPVPIRDVLAWNPLLHCVDWFRTTFFDGYQPQWLDRQYAIVGSLVLVLIGLLLEAAFRRHLRKPV